MMIIHFLPGGIKVCSFKLDQLLYELFSFFYVPREKIGDLCKHNAFRHLRWKSQPKILAECIMDPFLPLRLAVIITARTYYWSRLYAKPVTYIVSFNLPNTHVRQKLLLPFFYELSGSLNNFAGSCGWYVCRTRTWERILLTLKPVFSALWLSCLLERFGNNDSSDCVTRTVVRDSTSQQS